MGKNKQSNGRIRSKDVIQKQIEYIREKELPRHKITDLDRLIFTGLMAISLLFVGVIVNNISLDNPLTISLFCFAFSIPGLAMSIFEQSLNEIYGFGVKYWPKYILSFLSVIATIAGVCSVFWHFGWQYALVFFCASFLACIIIMRYHIILGIAFEKRIDEKESKNQ